MRTTRFHWIRNSEQITINKEPERATKFIWTQPFLDWQNKAELSYVVTTRGSPYKQRRFVEFQLWGNSAREARSDNEVSLNTISETMVTVMFSRIYIWPTRRGTCDRSIYIRWKKTGGKHDTNEVSLNSKFQIDYDRQGARTSDEVYLNSTISRINNREPRQQRGFVEFRIPNRLRSARSQNEQRSLFESVITTRFHWIQNFK